MSDSRLVYSTDGGDRRPVARRPAQPRTDTRLPDDGVVRITREKGGRGGKEVTVVHGLPGPEASLRALAGDLKRACGVGGTVKGLTIEIQGDQRTRIVALLEARGFRVKLAGG